MLEFDFHSDAGHGWLKVHVTQLIDFAPHVEFSNHSYHDDEHFYLEEDCDAPKFLRELTIQGIVYSFNEIFDGDDSFIRSLDSVKFLREKTKKLLKSID